MVEQSGTGRDIKRAGGVRGAISLVVVSLSLGHFYYAGAPSPRMSHEISCTVKISLPFRLFCLEEGTVQYIPGSLHPICTGAEQGMGLLVVAFGIAGRG